MGNDVVDRRAGDTAGKSGNDRFVGRVLTPAEHRAFMHSRDPGQELWSVWAAKETAYKAISKSWPDISASPGQYQTVFEDAIGGVNRTGVVQTPKQPVHVLVMIRKEYIHCIGQTRYHPNSGHLVWGLEVVAPEAEQYGNSHSRDPSESVRQAAAGRMASCLAVSAPDITIRRHPGSRGLGPPAVYIRGVKSDIDLSLSHHGRFAAYAFYLPQP